MVVNTKHQYHYSETKNSLQKIVDLTVPLGLFLFFFYFYNFGKVTPSEMIKTSGLLAITLLGVTLVIGPLCKFFPFLDFLKVHRKFWGILSAFIALVHALLVFVYDYNLDIFRLLDSTNSKFSGLLSGLAALTLLVLITLSSNRKALHRLGPELWKTIQMMSYIALFLAVFHFYLMEAVNGVLVIKRLLGRVTFGFAAAVIVVRLLVMFVESRQKKT